MSVRQTKVNFEFSDRDGIFEFIYALSQWRSLAHDTSFRLAMEKLANERNFAATRYSCPGKTKYPSRTPSGWRTYALGFNVMSNTEEPPICFLFKHKEGKFMSNFFPCRIYWREHRFKCSEQAYQWAKAHFAYQSCEIRRIDVQAAIMETNDPVQMKRLGKVSADQGKQGSESDLQVKIDARKFNDIKLAIMACILFEKFTQNADLGRELVETHPRKLIEASPNDGFWGGNDDVRGLQGAWRTAKRDGRDFRPKGENQLGNLLMELRDHLRGLTPWRKGILVGDSMLHEIDMRDKCFIAFWRGASIEKTFEILSFCQTKATEIVIYHAGTNNMAHFGKKDSVKPEQQERKRANRGEIEKAISKGLTDFESRIKKENRGKILFYFSGILQRHCDPPKSGNGKSDVQRAVYETNIYAQRLIWKPEEQVPFGEIRFKCLRFLDHSNFDHDKSLFKTDSKRKISDLHLNEAGRQRLNQNLLDAFEQGPSVQQA